jgi:predicted RNase H-like nuclease (RuvC/YqgF family)
MSSSQQQESHNDGPDNVDGEGGEGATAMDTTATATSTWDLAREASSKLVLQSHLEDMETRATKQKEELQQLRRRTEDAETSLAGSRMKIETLESTVQEKNDIAERFEKELRGGEKENEILKESTESERERADRSQVESDRLREEIRYVKINKQTHTHTYTIKIIKNAKRYVCVWSGRIILFSHEDYCGCILLYLIFFNIILIYYSSLPSFALILSLLV